MIDHPFCFRNKLIGPLSIFHECWLLIHYFTPSTDQNGCRVTRLGWGLWWVQRQGGTHSHTHTCTRLAKPWTPQGCVPCLTERLTWGHKNQPPPGLTCQSHTQQHAGWLTATALPIHTHTPRGRQTHTQILNTPATHTYTHPGYTLRLHTHIQHINSCHQNAQSNYRLL